MTRVLVIEAAGNLWGSERSLLDMLSVQEGLEVTVCCPAGRPLVQELEKRGIRSIPTFVYRLHMKSRWQRLVAAIAVLRACLSVRPHVIHLNQSGSYKVARLAARLLRIPIVAHVRIFEDAAYLAAQRPNPRQLRSVIAISGAIEQELRRFPELDAIKIERFYNAYVPQKPPSVGRARRRVACVGRLVPVKGQDILIRALGWLRDRGTDADCVIAGDGNPAYVAALKAVADDLAVTSIEWAGFVGDTTTLLRDCDVLVCPSHREPLGRVIFEAWDTGIVPIVFEGSGGAAEIVRACDGGLVYSEQSPESLGLALEKALRLDEAARARLVQNGREWMAAHCDPERYGIAMARVLAEASGIPGPRRALVIDAAGNLWGSERSLLDLIERLPGIDVAVCCPPASPLLTELRERGVRSLPYYIYGLHEKTRTARLRAALGVLRACLEFRPAVLYLNQSGSYKVVLPAARLLRIPIVAHIRIFEDAAYLAKQRPTAPRFAALIAISGAIEEEIRRFDSLRSIPIHRMYDGYASRQALPGRGTMPGRRIACVGRLVPIKGQDLLLRALPIVAASGRDIECVVVGDGDAAFLDDLRQLAHAGRLDGTIRWPGFVREIGPLLRTCDVLACPSHREPLGRVILEAWDAGAIPVVFSGSGGAAEIVAAAGGGIIYESQDPGALADAIRRALDLPPHDAAQMIANGRAWVARNCDPDQYGRRIAGVFERAADRAGAVA